MSSTSIIPDTTLRNILCSEAAWARELADADTTTVRSDGTGEVGSVNDGFAFSPPTVHHGALLLDEGLALHCFRSVLESDDSRVDQAIECPLVLNHISDEHPILSFLQNLTSRSR
jgi:hypothetical protein